jgi:hypothetical protein
MFKQSLVPAALLAAVLIPLVGNTASAQSVRRHLHCRLADGLAFGVLVTQSTGKAVVAINNWSRTIPKGTRFTYRIGDSSRATTFTSTSALPPGGEMLVGSTPAGESCRVSIPG